MAEYSKLFDKLIIEDFRFSNEDETGECNLSYAELKSMMDLGLICIKQRDSNDPEFGYIDYVVTDGYTNKDINKAIMVLKKEDT